MLGFAIVDRQSNSAATAVWLTSREGARVNHTNAVVIPHSDERHDAKVRALTLDRAAVLTIDTVSPAKFACPLTVGDFDGLIDETAVHQQRISQAIAEYKARMRNKTLVLPDFPATPRLNAAERDEPALRALSVANYVASVWRAWLATDEQRVRRTTDPRSGARPWIMPEELGQPHLAVFPPKFAARMRPEPLA